MKTLYISDLDGTLLNSDQQLDSVSADILRKTTASGAYFTFATARTAASALKIMADAGVNVPCILMNGVCIYDMQAEDYVMCRYIPHDKALSTAALLDRLGFGGFMYRIDGGRLSCYYTSLENDSMREFCTTRRQRYNKNFVQVESLTEVCDDKVVYFCITAPEERLKVLRQEVSGMDGLLHEFYGDVYDRRNWYLEIFHESASKAAGVEYLRKNYGFDRIIAFGDNYNDLPMFRASDLSYAVPGAAGDVKRQADRIVHDGVPCEIARLAAEKSDNEL